MKAVLLALALLAQDEVDHLIAQLSDADLVVRDEAMAKLIKEGARLRDRIQKLLASGDAELRGRARRILDAWPPEYAPALEARSTQRFAIAPDGSAIAYYDRDGHLVVADPDGKERFTVPYKGRPGADRATPYWGAAGLMADPDGESLRPVAADKIGDPFLLQRADGSALVPSQLMLQVASTGDGITTVPGRLLCVFLADKNRAYELPRCTRGVISSDAELIVAIHEGEALLGKYVGRGRWKNKDCKNLVEKFTLITAPPDLARVTLARAGASSLVQIDPATLAETARAELKDAKIRTLDSRRDGKWLLVGTDEGKVLLHDEASLKALGAIDVGAVPSFVAASDDGAVVGVLADRRVRVYRRK